VRMPGGFLIGSAFALRLLDVPDEHALVMILFIHVTTILLVVGIGLIVLWRSGIDIRHARFAAWSVDDRN
jgi:glycosyltransferase 2 family protein